VTAIWQLFAPRTLRVCGKAPAGSTSTKGSFSKAGLEHLLQIRAFPASFSCA
jgi:hypothetical protein